MQRCWRRRTWSAGSSRRAALRRALGDGAAGRGGRGVFKRRGVSSIAAMESTKEVPQLEREPARCRHRTWEVGCPSSLPDPPLPPRSHQTDSDHPYPCTSQVKSTRIIRVSGRSSPEAPATMVGGPRRRRFFSKMPLSNHANLHSKTWPKPGRRHNADRLVFVTVYSNPAQTPPRWMSRERIGQPRLHSGNQSVVRRS